MIISNKFRGLHIIMTLCVGLIFFVSCASQPNSMALVNQNLNEDRLVPAAAVEQLDVLNLYSHNYKTDKNLPITIDITFDKTNVLHTGGEGYMQIALLAQPAVIKQSRVQFLVYDDSLITDNKNVLSNIVDTTKQFILDLPQGSELFVDSSFKRNGLFKKISQFKRHDNPKFIDFVKFYSRQEFTNKASQLVFILGDIGKLLKSEKQNVIDMTRILTAKGVRTSVLSYGDSPDFSFYNKIAEVGDGYYRIHNSVNDYKQWINAEIQDLHALNFTNLNITASAKNNLIFSSIISPKNQKHDNNTIKFKLDRFTEGSKYIMFAKVKFPKLNGKPKKNVVNVTLDYFDNNNNKFKKLSVNKHINYVFDKNGLSSEVNSRIQRSNLILKTYSVISEIDSMIKQRRYYNAIALLTSQKRKLEKYLIKYNDNELTRDIKILEKYVNKLYSFDDKVIQFWQINKDLHWDNARYTSRYL